MPVKRGGRRRSRNRNFIAIPFQVTKGLGTLASDVVVSQNLTNPFGEDLYIISIDGAWSLRDLTAGEGPIGVGYHHGDLTVTEVLENLQAQLTDPDDIIQKERARRPVRSVGQFPGLAQGESLNNGNRFRTRIGFTVGNDHNINMYVINRSGVANLTTGAEVVLDGVIYGRWLR